MTFEQVRFGTFLLQNKGRADDVWKPYDHILLMKAESAELVAQTGNGTSLLESLMLELLETSQDTPAYTCLAEYAGFAPERREPAQMDDLLNALVREVIGPLLMPRLVQVASRSLTEPPKWRLVFQWLLDGLDKQEREWIFKPVISYVEA